MNMRPPALDLPIMFIDVRVTAGAMAILDGVTLTISPGLPTVLIQEGGYDLGALGPLVREVLLGVEEGAS